MRSNTKIKYTVGRYNDLFCAVTRHGTTMHRELFNMMVEAGMNKRQIFTKFMKMLVNATNANTKILHEVGYKGTTWPNW